MPRLSWLDRYPTLCIKRRYYPNDQAQFETVDWCVTVEAK